MSRTGAPAATSSPLLRLARFAAQTSWDDVPAATRDLARLQLASVLASYATGFACNTVRLATRGLGVLPPTDTLLPPLGDDRASWVGALCTASMAYDFDDYLYMGHTGHSAVATTLADLLFSGGGQAPAPRGCTMGSGGGQAPDLRGRTMGSGGGQAPDLRGRTMGSGGGQAPDLRGRTMGSGGGQAPDPRGRTMGSGGGQAIGAAPTLQRTTLGDAAGREALTRIVIGNEIGGRIGATVFFGPHNGQLWSFIHLPVAAALHGRALGLDEERIAHAMAIALAQPPHPLPAGFMGTETKLLTAATPAMIGYRAAELAAAGLRGNLDILDAPRGFFEEFSFVPLPQMISGLGKTWVTDTLSFKRYPGCAYLGSILDALAEIRNATGLAASDVRRIDVEGTFLTVEMDEMARPHRQARPTLDPVLVNFSVADTVALDVLTGGMRCADLEPDALAARAPEIRALAAKVRLSHAWGLSVDLLRSVNRAVPLGSLLGGIALAEAREIRRQARRYHGKTLDIGFATLRRIAAELSGSEARALARFFGGRALGRRAPRAPFDLGNVSFVSFELPVAARVTVETNRGVRHVGTVRRPEGSPQTTGRRDVPREKLLRDVAEISGTEMAERIWQAVASLPESWDTLMGLVLPVATEVSET